MLMPFPVLIIECAAQPGHFDSMLGVSVKTSLFIKLFYLAAGCYVMSVNQEHLKPHFNCFILLHE